MDTDGYVVVRAFYRRSVKKRSGSGRPFPCSFFCGRRGKNLLYTPSGLGRQRKRMPCAGNDYDPYGSSGVLEPDLGQVEKMLEKEGIAVAGCPAKEGKIAFRDWEFYEKAGKLADVILVEADGSKRLPVKVPGPKEPVIPENSDQILCIYGLGALGKQAADCCFRMQPSEQLLKIPEDQKDGKWIMTEEKMSLLMKKGYLEPLRQQFPYSQVIPVFNQADTMKLEENGKNILERMEEERGILTGELWKETSFNLF